jgi:hypothetical protein
MHIRQKSTGAHHGSLRIYSLSGRSRNRNRYRGAAADLALNGYPVFVDFGNEGAIRSLRRWGLRNTRTAHQQYGGQDKGKLRRIPLSHAINTHLLGLFDRSMTL